MEKAKEPLGETAGFELTAEEKALILEARKRAAEPASDGSEPKVAVSELAKALVLAIEQTRPPVKKTPFNRPKPWEEKKPALKRTWYQHGQELFPRQLSAEAITLLNQAKPGIFVNGLVHIVKNRDRSYNITWPVRTAAQRLRVINEAGATFAAIVRRCIDEYNDPNKFKGPEDRDDDD